MPLSYLGVALTLCYSLIVSLPYLYNRTVVSVYRTYLGSCPHLGAVFSIPEYHYTGDGI